jgi:hypothetical protein
VALLFLLAPLLTGAPFPPGQIKSGDKKWQAAAANYRTLLRYQPKDADANFMLANVLLEYVKQADQGGAPPWPRPPQAAPASAPSSTGGCDIV